MSKTTILLIPGFYHSKRLFDPLCHFLEQAGFETKSLDIVPNNGTASIESLAGKLKRYIQKKVPRSNHIVLIGFSMGGLIARYYIQALGEDRRIKSLITISSPHHGTKCAYLLPLIATREMRPQSAFLRNLSRFPFPKMPFLSLWTKNDFFIVPARSSVVSGAKNIEIKTIFHLNMLTDQKCMETIKNFLKQSL